MNISNFVADQLDKIAKNEQFLDYKIEEEPVSKDAFGFQGQMLAVALIGNRKIGNKIVSKSKLHLMCKLLPEIVERRELFHSLSASEREIHIYNNVLTVFDQFQCEKNIPINDRFTEYPRCYAAVADSEMNEHIIVMENLKSAGYGLWDKTKPVDYDAACLTLKALGKFHALSFALRDQKQEVFNNISDLQDVFGKMVADDNSPVKGIVAGSLDRAFSVLDQPDEKKIMQNLRDNCRDETLRLASKYLAGKFYVICHGDFWNYNIFHLNEESVR